MFAPYDLPTLQRSFVATPMLSSSAPTTVRIAVTAAESAINMEQVEKPRLLFFRTVDEHLPKFIRSHLDQHTKCLSMSFSVTVISGDCDYQAVCDQHKPDLCLFESGVYCRPSRIANTSAHAEIPKLGFLNADAYCRSRSVFLSDMERFGVETFFTISVSMADYMPTAAGELFVWPNFVDQDIFRDFGEIKRVPALITGSHAMHYPFRNCINSIIADNFPTLRYPHFGWFDAEGTSKMLHDEQYARLINSVYLVATCGTIANEAVRKHFEIPACRTCLVTEQTPALDAAGFVDMQNCVFVTREDVLDKINYLLENHDVLEKITRAGHFLVHSRHTIRHRHQIWQWFQLQRTLRPGQKIVQADPFGPLAVGEAGSMTRRSVWDSHSLDRAILRKGDTEFYRGNYSEAERCYISCLNYHFMPEPCLGLTLCNLHKGDADAAAGWIAQSIPTDLSLQPDPVEWAWYTLSILCAGRLGEAMILANQFPQLHHIELDRCRSAIAALAGDVHRIADADHELHPISRLSIHMRKRSDMTSWIEELCFMLRACEQVEFAERLLRAAALPAGGRPKPSWTAVAASRVAAAGGIALTLNFFSFRQVVVRKLPLLVRRFLNAARSLLMPLLMPLTRVRLLLRSHDKLAAAVQAQVRKQQVGSAVIVGGHGPSVYAHAFLDGLRRNSSMPTVFWPGLGRAEVARLTDCRYTELKIETKAKSIAAAKEAAEVEYFDIVFLDKDACDKKIASQAIVDAGTIVICDITTSCGHELASRILSDFRYRVLADDEYQGGRYAIFTKKDPVRMSNWSAQRAERRRRDNRALPCK